MSSVRRQPNTCRWVPRIWGLLALGVLAPGWAQSVRHAAPLQLSEHASRDQASIDALSARVQALQSSPLTPDNPWETYQRAKSAAWLDFAFDARAQRDQSGVVEAAQAQAMTLVEGLERGDRQLSLDTPLIASANREREDLWQWVAAVKADARGRCASAELAQLEVQLVQAGHADHRLGPRHARPYLQAVDRLLRTARPLMEHCPPQSGAGLGIHASLDALPKAPSPSALALPDEAGDADVAPPARLAPSTPEQLAAPTPVTEREPETPPKSALSAPAGESLVRSPAPNPAIQEVATSGIAGRVYFGFNRTSVPKASRLGLDRIASVLKQDSGATVDLRGHADRQGRRRYNLTLSAHRAAQVRTYLLRAGVNAAQIQREALGSSQPLSRGFTLVDHARNRRVDMYLVGPLEPLLGIAMPAPVVELPRKAKHQGRTRR